LGRGLILPPFFSLGDGKMEFNWISATTIVGGSTALAIIYILWLHLTFKIKNKYIAATAASGPILLGAYIAVGFIT